MVISCRPIFSLAALSSVSISSSCFNVLAKMTISSANCKLLRFFLSMVILSLPQSRSFIIFCKTAMKNYDDSGSPWCEARRLNGY